MKILITGGLGYIGSHISSLLGKKAVIVDNRSNSALNYKKKLPYAKVYINEINVRSLKKIFLENKITGVIHLSSLKAANESIFKPLHYYEQNVFTTIQLLKTMRNFNVNKLIFSSSATVYGARHLSPLKENYSLNGINPYANSKIFIEQIIKDYSNTNPKFRSFSLRYFNPIGADTDKGLSDCPLGEPQNIMPILVRAIERNKVFKIFGGDYDTPDGTCIRDYIHVKDVAEAHLCALKKLSKIKGSKSINIGLGKGISVLKLINIFEKVNNISVQYSFTKRRKGDVAISFADTQKSKTILQWKPKYSYDDMVRDSWESFLKF